MHGNLPNGAAITFSYVCFNSHPGLAEQRNGFLVFDTPLEVAAWAFVSLVAPLCCSLAVGEFGCRRFKGIYVGDGL
jgi:hypothetical protein